MGFVPSYMAFSLIYLSIARFLLWEVPQSLKKLPLLLKNLIIMAKLIPGELHSELHIHVICLREEMSDL